MGVKIMTGEAGDSALIPQFTGVSYCEALLMATLGAKLLVVPSSIKVCQWSPVILGLKAAGNAFEKSIQRPLTGGIRPIYLAPISMFNKKDKPDVVIIRAEADTFRAIIGILGNDAFIPYQQYGRDETALSIFSEGPLKGFSRWAVPHFNGLLHRMNDLAWWHKTTTFLFKSTTVTRLFDRFITRYMANMSICRNSTVIPCGTGKANISFFCTGGIAWGKNFPGFLTSGFPYDLYKKIESRLVYPGLSGYDQPSAALDSLRKQMPKAPLVQTETAI